MPLAHPTRNALLDAGVKIAEEHGLSNMTIDQIVREAGVAKGTFYVHFPNRVIFLVELHRQFHDHLKQLILTEIEGIPYGTERLYRAAITYLDGCLMAKAVKAFLLEARSEAAVSAEVGQRNTDFALLAQADFIAMGWSHSEAAARLFVVMCAEVALMELKLGQRDESARAALMQYINR